jgi:hypothetical protein
MRHYKFVFVALSSQVSDDNVLLQLILFVVCLIIDPSLRLDWHLVVRLLELLLELLLLSLLWDEMRMNELGKQQQQQQSPLTFLN